MFDVFLLILTLAVQPLWAGKGTLQEITDDFGPNPGGVHMFLYRPPIATEKPVANASFPLVVAMHTCYGSGPEYYNDHQYDELADEHAFLVLYPSVNPRPCFDTYTAATLKHDGGGDSQGIASMIKYTIANFGADPQRVFVTGSSSGAMMTAVMMGTYPDLFQAASVYSGEPFGCVVAEGTPVWEEDCARGRMHRAAQEWGDLVRNAYPGYTGPRPKVTIWHGQRDQLLLPISFPMAIAQWSNIFNYTTHTDAPTVSVVQDHPEHAYITTTFGPALVGIFAENEAHTVPVHEERDLRWFGILEGPADSGAARQLGGHGSLLGLAGSLVLVTWLYVT